MKIGVIADPHSNLQAFRAVLKDMPRVNSIICAGDLVGYGAQPNEVVDIARKKGIRTVLGNHDYSAVTRDVSGFNPMAAEAALWTAEHLTEENSKFLRGLPKEVTLSEGGKPIYMVHGSPRRPLTEYIFPGTPNQVLLRLVQGIEADVIILGHTHVPMQQLIQGKLLLNPGGVGQPRDRDPRASYAVLDLKDEPRAEFKRVKYDIGEAAKKIEEEGLPKELATRLYFGW